jgi:hypothetical protein
MRLTHAFVFPVAAALVVLVTSCCQATTIEVFRFSFDNASVGALTAPASDVADGVSATWSTPNTGVENLGDILGNAGLVRNFSDTTFQSITFTTAEAMNISSLAFWYQGNTNAYPTFPSYDVSAFFNDSSLGTFTNSQSNVPFAVTMAGPGWVEAGSHEIRWIAPAFTGGINSGTDYMALDNVVLTAVSVPEIGPNSLGSVLALVLGSLGFLERRRMKAT